MTRDEQMECKDDLQHRLLTCKIIYDYKKVKIFGDLPLQMPRWHLEKAKVKFKYANRKPPFDVLFDGDDR